MNIILVPLLLPRNFSPFGKHAWYPLSRATDVHRSTNRRNKIPNYPWKNHDKIVRNWHPSICIRVHRSFTPSIDLCRTNVWRTNLLLPFQRNKTVSRRQTRIKMRPQTCLEGNFVRDIRLIIRGKNPISILVDSSYPISIRLFLRFSGKEGAVGGISVEKGIEIFL